MKTAIIGSNSFLAREIIDAKIFPETNLHLMGVENEGNRSNFSFFKFPDVNLKFEYLLNFDCIIYCAGAGIQSNLKEEINLIYELNVFLPIRICNYLNQNNYKGKFLTFGSYFEIGDNSEDIKYSELDIIKSLNKVPNDYCISKRLLSRYVSSSFSTMQHYHLFLPNIYGRNENPNRLIPYVINNVLKKREMEFTEGTQMRQYLHIRDLIRFIDKAMNKEHLSAGIYNIAPDISYSVKEIVQTIFEILDTPFSKDFFGKKEGRDESMKILQMNNSKMKANRFTTEINLKSGILEYLN